MIDTVIILRKIIVHVLFCLFSFQSMLFSEVTNYCFNIHCQIIS
uniref:Uncharacterized protein n=1 Tax=Rhizophora mucronata TaxID=61149 RepID=A0A2P2QIN6_RHIMU